MEKLLRTMFEAFREVKNSETPNPATLHEALQQLQRIDFGLAEQAEPGSMGPGIGPKELEAQNFVSHLMSRSPKGAAVMVKVAILNGALHAHPNLPEEGHDLRDATTRFINRLEMNGAIWKKKETRRT